MRLEELRSHDLPPLLTVDEAISRGLIRSSRPRAYEDIRAGNLPVIRSGRRVWLPTAALLARLGLDQTQESKEAGSHRPPAPSPDSTSPKEKSSGEFS